MDVVEFIKTRSRMCRVYDDCADCPLDFFCEEEYQKQDFGDCAVKAVRTVEQWAKEHPVKTRQSEMLKLFPDADMHNGVLEFCPQRFGYFKDNRKCCEPKTECNECKRDFWLKEIK